MDRVLSSYEFAMEVAARAARKKPHHLDPSRVIALIFAQKRNIWAVDSTIKESTCLQPLHPALMIAQQSTLVTPSASQSQVFTAP